MAQLLEALPLAVAVAEGLPSLRGALVGGRSFTGSPGLIIGGWGLVAGALYLITNNPFHGHWLVGDLQLIHFRVQVACWSRKFD